MADKEYTVIEIVDVLRRHVAGDKISAIARATGMDRKTVRKYIRIAERKGHTGKDDASIEEIAHAVFQEVNGGDKAVDGNSRDAILLPHKGLIADWVDRENLTLTKVHMKLLRSGIETSYSSLYRFAQEHIGSANSGTVRMAETEPGEVAEVDFGRLEYLYDNVLKRKRALHALVVTLVFSRYQYVYVTHKQDLPALIGGIEEAWEFFGGVTRRLIIDNLLCGAQHKRFYVEFSVMWSKRSSAFVAPIQAELTPHNGCIYNESSQQIRSLFLRIIFLSFPSFTDEQCANAFCFI